MIRIYADFNDIDVENRVVLNVFGALRDIKALREPLVAGMTVMLYAGDEFDVEAKLVFDRYWRGVPDYKTLRYYDCPELLERIGTMVTKIEVIEWHRDVRDPAPTRFEIQIWFGDQPVRLTGGANGQDLVIHTTAWQPFPPGDAVLDDFVACRDVSSEPPYVDLIGRRLTAVEPRHDPSPVPTGASLRFGDAVLHVHVEFDDLFLTWGGDVPAFGGAPGEDT